MVLTGASTSTTSLPFDQAPIPSISPPPSPRASATELVNLHTDRKPQHDKQVRDKLLAQLGLGRESVIKNTLPSCLNQWRWFGFGGKVARSVTIKSQVKTGCLDDSGHELTWLLVNVHLEGGEKKRMLVPAFIDTNGTVSRTDAFTSKHLQEIVLDHIKSGRYHVMPENRTAQAWNAGKVSKFAWARSQFNDVKNTLTQAGKQKYRPMDLETDSVSDSHINFSHEAKTLRKAIFDGEKNRWSAVAKNTTPAWFRHVEEQAKRIAPQNPKAADALLVTFYHQVFKTLKAQPAEVREFHERQAAQPRASKIIVGGYTEFMGIPDSHEAGNFGTLREFATFMRERYGITALQIMPPYRSPKRDGGYDIAKHDEFDPALGGDKEFTEFMNDFAIQHGGELWLDSVPNHVSSEHEWMVAFQNGEKEAENRFIVRDESVKVITYRTRADNDLHNAILELGGKDAGKITRAPITLGTDLNPDTLVPTKFGSIEHKLYETFMAVYQPDVNLEDPVVMAEHVLGPIGKHLNMGVRGIRVDAVALTGKEWGTDNANRPNSRAFVAFVKAFEHHVARGSEAMPEVFMPWKDLTEQWIKPQTEIDSEKVHLYSDMAIGFDFHRNLWSSMVTRDKRYVLGALARIGELGEGEHVMKYFTSHDETKFSEQEPRKQLLDKGKQPFGPDGIGDAPGELLDHNPERVASGLMLTLLGPGDAMVYYRLLGDLENNKEHYDKQKKKRMEAQISTGMAAGPRRTDEKKAKDARDLDRGPLAMSRLEEFAKTSSVAKVFGAIVDLKKSDPAVGSKTAKEIPNPDSGVASLALLPPDVKDLPALALTNLTDEEKTVELGMEDLKKELKWSGANRLVDVLSQAVARYEGRTGVSAPGVPFEIKNDKLMIKLAPNGRFILREAGLPAQQRNTER